MNNERPEPTEHAANKAIAARDKWWIEMIDGHKCMTCTDAPAGNCTFMATSCPWWQRIKQENSSGK